ncbi:MAG TPA: hypothetical protein PKY83_03540 [Bacteroidales bacterium]|jgi:hypothetical protein|nr:hypothetical protein [Bacteroidales bacterium]OQC57729.1 MAG: hypothetical protein BWX52_00754 [Bacteroidetes bacterium ADurb.Bin013]MBV6456146.1 hypothetical protein [Bacteroidales bacterium]MCZ2316508.1 hypothetical protein [Bacteroidales bacterium]HNR27527.1 hypothetical protein [Bacteroidales bacterium]
MNKSLFFTVLSILLISAATDAHACTSAIITGKVTANGKPMLWKHRDTGQEQNRIAYFDSGKYGFLALTDAPDKGEEAWIGTNKAGFSIMNTASYNLKDDEVREMDREGKLMFRALEICAGLEDFERFLDTLSRPMRVEANFGVIDASGGAAFYEVNNHSWVKLDVNDPAIAPHGYLVYTNFSYTGRINQGKGYMRYMTASDLFLEKSAIGGFTPQWIFSHVSRSFYHAFLGIDLCDPAFSTQLAKGWFIDQDFIPRRSSTCSIVIEGVKPGEDPLNTIMWTVLGYPPAGVCVPLWVNMESRQPALLVGQGENNRSPLCEKAVGLKHRVFSVERGNGPCYMHFSLIYNSEGTGFMQQLTILEGSLFEKYNALIDSLEKEGMTGKKLAKKSVGEMYKEVSALIEEVYDRL